MRRRILNALCVVLLFGGIAGDLALISNVVSREGEFDIFDMAFGCFFTIAGFSALYVLHRKSRLGINLVIVQMSLIGTGVMTWEISKISHPVSPLLTVLEAMVTLLVVFFAYVGLRKAFLPLAETDPGGGERPEGGGDD